MSQKYTLEDLNAASNGSQFYQEPQAAAWSAVSKAAAEGPSGAKSAELSSKMAKLAELKKKQQQQFTEKQNKIIGAQIHSQAVNGGNGGIQSLEDMGLDNQDNQESQIYDPYYNPTSTGTTSTGIELKAQNMYMGKDTSKKMDLQQPNQRQPDTNKDDLDDLESIEDIVDEPVETPVTTVTNITAPTQVDYQNGFDQQRAERTMGQQYPSLQGMPPQQHQPETMVQAAPEDFENPAMKLAKKKKKKKKKRADQPTEEEVHEQQQKQLQEQLLRQKEYEEQIRLEQEAEAQAEADAEEKARQAEMQDELARQQALEYEETEAKLREIQMKQEALEEEQRRLEELAAQQEEEERREEEEQLEYQKRLQEEEEKQKQEAARKKKRHQEQQRQKEEEKVLEEEVKNQPPPEEEEESDEEDPGFIEGAPKYYQPGIVPQAPLKPSQKDAHDAFISKLLNPYLKLEELKELYMKPLPALIGQVQCTIQRHKGGLIDRMYPKYTLSLSNGNKYLLTGKKRSLQSTSNYMITIEQKKFIKDSNGYLGKVRSNFLGTEFCLFDSKENPKKASPNEETRQQMGVVQYETNVLGSKGPRRMKVLLPMVSQDGKAMNWPDSETEKETIQGKFADNQSENIMFFFNKPPKWNEQVQAFVLNFNGRVDKASVKNFQLIDEYDDNKIYMQFGRVGKDLFNMDCAFPFSLFQAYGIALSSFDFKFACE